MLSDRERIFTEIIVLHEAIHSVKIDYDGADNMPEGLKQLIDKWELRISSLTDKLHDLDKYLYE